MPFASARRALKRALPFPLRFALTELRAGTAPKNLLATLWDDERAFVRTEAKLRERMREERSLDDMIETAFRFQGFGRYRTFKPQQNEGEIKALLEEVGARKPKTIVEVGTGRGGTLYLYCRYLTSATRILTIDLPSSDRSQWNNERLWRGFSDRAELAFLQGDSHGTAIREQVRALVGPEGADFIFIDGDHSYEGVKSDVLGFLPFLAKDGVLAMHDVHLNDSGVPRFWNEFETQRRTRTIVSPEPPAPGIGVVYG